MKKKLISLLLVGCLLTNNQIVNAKSSTSVRVGGKSVVMNSKISKTTASSYTGSDGTVKARVTSDYYYAKAGIKHGPISKNSGFVYGVASVGFSAGKEGVSLTVVSNHTAIYGGDRSDANTSASY